MPDILSKFSTHYQKILNQAYFLAKESGRDKLAPTDLLLALATERGSLATEILERHNLTPSLIREKFGYQTANNNSTFSREPTILELKDLFNNQLLAENIKKVIERSVVSAWRFQHQYVGSEHLLLALTSDQDEEIKKMWSNLQVDLNKLNQTLLSVLKSTSKFPDITEFFANVDTKTENLETNGTSALNFFGTELTSDEALKRIDPLIGRTKEIERVINILARRTKNNPLLVGEPGVGKTAIVEGLAKRIKERTVPDWLLDKKIYGLDLGLLVAGTMYRGEFENRLKQIIDEVKNNQNIILFIDEVHMIVGAGAAPGSLDIANLLKPALAKGQIRCIGATTPEEYKKYIESDAALERRFQLVTVKEISPAETIAVLKGIKQNYEQFHSVTITKEAIEAAVYLSERYLPDKFLPDKAIDLIDEAASNLKTQKPPSAQSKLIKELEAKIKQLTQAKEYAVEQENFVLASQYKEEEDKVSQELETLKKKVISEHATNLKLGREDIAYVVSQITGVPLTELLASERKTLSNLEKILSQYIKGQDEAVTTISRFIRRARLGVSSSNKPIGSFLFLGPSGVGKTELAKVVAREVFGEENALIRIDMSEFSEAFNISKLIGAPAGYIGYKDSNKLTDQVKKRPSSVVLFDEIEKAHPDVFNLLLQIMDEGYLTDASGKQINFKNCLIIMTSNLGVKELNQQASIGFEAESETDQNKFGKTFAATKAKLLEEVKKFFRPEFLNRLDAVLVFNPLLEKDLEKIVKLQLDELTARLKQQKLKVIITLAKGAAAAIARACWSPTEGARGIKRWIQEKVENYISDKLLTLGQTKKGFAVKILVKDKEIVVL